MLCRAVRCGCNGHDVFSQGLKGRINRFKYSINVEARKFGTRDRVDYFPNT